MERQSYKACLMSVNSVSWSSPFSRAESDVKTSTQRATDISFPPGLLAKERYSYGQPVCAGLGLSCIKSSWQSIFAKRFVIVEWKIPGSLWYGRGSGRWRAVTVTHPSPLLTRLDARIPEQSDQKTGLALGSQELRSGRWVMRGGLI
ncbi:unnamed protein product [Rangifer tarandus platyrhynchus]|uniref:Uncharacterized protein n=1 Tax=Rangifer tarandus platyrhynchus TaxID=3082113 RepID=A0ABN8Y9D3_RANTA|nr:unnamed protein product [Rangifer tarandus platyrhynchus]